MELVSKMPCIAIQIWTETDFFNVTYHCGGMYQISNNKYYVVVVSPLAMLWSLYICHYN